MIFANRTGLQCPPLHPLTVIRERRSRSAERTAQPLTTAARENAHSAMPSPASHQGVPTSSSPEAKARSTYSSDSAALDSWPRSTPTPMPRSREARQPTAVGTADKVTIVDTALRDDAEASRFRLDPHRIQRRRVERVTAPNLLSARAANSTPTSPTCSDSDDSPRSERDRDRRRIRTRARPVLEPPSAPGASLALRGYRLRHLERRYLRRPRTARPSDPTRTGTPGDSLTARPVSSARRSRSKR